jgi:hypothetical protein
LSLSSPSSSSARILAQASQLAPAGFSLTKDPPPPPAADGGGRTVVEGASVNVYPEAFDPLRFAAEEEEENKTEEADEEEAAAEGNGSGRRAYADTAREATVTRLVSQEEVEVQYDDDQELQVVARARLQVMADHDDELSVSLGDDERTCVVCARARVLLVLGGGAGSGVLRGGTRATT